MLSALFVTLAVFTKQLTAPLIVVLPAYVALVYGRKCCFRYVKYILIGCTGAFIVFYVFFNGSEMFFNVVTLVKNHPMRGQSDGAAKFFIRYTAELFQLCLNPLMVIALYGALAHIVWPARKSAARQWLKKQRWVFQVYQ